jgi:hypothetical protein
VIPTNAITCFDVIGSPWLSLPDCACETVLEPVTANQADHCHFNDHLNLNGIVDHACLPFAPPKTSTIKSEIPLTTFGWSAPHKDRLSQLSTKESDVCHEAGQQPLEEAHDRKNFAFRRAASSGQAQRLAAQVAVVG